MSDSLPFVPCYNVALVCPELPVQHAIKFALKFLLLVILLNLVRYFVGGPIEGLLIVERVFNAMAESPSYFNTQFTTFDWVTSFFYNFMIWLTCTWVYAKMHHSFRGNPVVKSLQVYGLMFLFFASVSAVYMNHYSHPKDFYIYNILDGLVVFPIVAVANGLLYPRFFRGDAAGR